MPTRKVPCSAPAVWKACYSESCNKKLDLPEGAVCALSVHVMDPETKESTTLLQENMGLWFSFSVFERLYAWAVTVVAQRCAFLPFNSPTCRQGGMADIKCRKQRLRSLRRPARDNRAVPPRLPFDHTECQWNLSQLYGDQKGNRIKAHTRARRMPSARDTGYLVDAPLGAIEGSQ